MNPFSNDTPSTTCSDVYFLGGYDLEMVTIRELLQQHAPSCFHDKNLAWGARASHYQAEIETVLAAGKVAVLIELEEDFPAEDSPINNASRSEQIVIIDHHGQRAGQNRPTALEQVFARLKRPADEWSRYNELVSANDRGHIPAMVAIGASQEEIITIRQADRRAQGISADEEAIGLQAIATAEVLVGGRLTVVRLAHQRVATVTDPLDRHLGGTGYENLLILSPNATHFFGEGIFIERLAKGFHGSYFGGDLPARGFWGCQQAICVEEILTCTAIEGTATNDLQYSA